MPAGEMWTAAQDKLLREELAKGTAIKTLAPRIGKSAKAIYLYCYRHYIPMKAQCKNPIMRKILEVKFGDIELFHPNRAFFDRTGISQKRWAELAFGYSQPSEEEVKHVVKAINYDVNDALKFFDALQLPLFE